MKIEIKRWLKYSKKPKNSGQIQNISEIFLDGNIFPDNIRYNYKF